MVKECYQVTTIEKKIHGFIKACMLCQISGFFHCQGTMFV